MQGASTSNHGVTEGSMEVHPKGCPEGNEILPDEFIINIADYEYVVVCAKFETAYPVRVL